MNKKLLLDRLGHSTERGVKGYLQSLLGFSGRKRISPIQEEEQGFIRGVREQFLKLAEKGISIPVSTL